MKVKLPKHPALRFLICFTLWQVTLIALLSPADGVYNMAFGSIGNMLYGRNDQMKEIDFEPLNRGSCLCYTRVIIANPALMKPDGSGPVRNLDIGTRGFGGRSLALLASLILSSPVSWSRRWKALIWGTIWQQVLVFMILGYCIWVESSEVGLVSLSPAGKKAATGIQNALAGEMSLALPVLVWLMVTFRSEDGLLARPCGRRYRKPMKWAT